LASIILYHCGTPLPKHLFDCVAKIRQLSKIPVYLITDHPEPVVDIEVVDARDGMFSGLSSIVSQDYFSKHPLVEMWRGAALRMFYIQRFMANNFLDDVLHFDNDVMLFADPGWIVKTCRQLYSRCAVTCHTAQHAVMGMAYFPNMLEMDDITLPLERELRRPWGDLCREYDCPSEMVIISKQCKTEFLPVLPEGPERYASHFSDFASVFDPASYGQFLAGTHAHKRPGHMENCHAIGLLMIEGRIKTYMLGGKPYLQYDGVDMPINSLHVHSKLTEQFL